MHATVRLFHACCTHDAHTLNVLTAPIARTMLTSHAQAAEVQPEVRGERVLQCAALRLPRPHHVLPHGELQPCRAAGRSRRGEEDERAGRGVERKGRRAAAWVLW